MSLRAVRAAIGGGDKGEENAATQLDSNDWEHTEEGKKEKKIKKKGKEKKPTREMGEISIKSG